MTASVAGLKSHPYSAAYCASKGGVVMLTRALSKLQQILGPDDIPR
jgi:NAD(P)-dependent dehydrogenase (short-subunit alcohol dehydrogenase family)